MISGGDVIHSVINISAIWLLLKLVPSGTALSVVVAFIFNTVSIYSAVQFSSFITHLFIT